MPDLAPLTAKARRGISKLLRGAARVATPQRGESPHPKGLQKRGEKTGGLFGKNRARLERNAAALPMGGLEYFLNASTWKTEDGKLLALTHARRSNTPTTEIRLIGRNRNDEIPF